MRRIHAWNVCYIIGFPMVCTAAWMLHEAIWPEYGRVLRHIRYRFGYPARPLPPDDFSRLDSLKFILFSYLPIAVDICLPAIGRWLQVREE